MTSGTDDNESGRVGAGTINMARAKTARDYRRMAKAEKDPRLAAKMQELSDYYTKASKE